MEPPQPQTERQSADSGPPRLRLDGDRLAEVQGHARRAYPEECCGLLTGRTERFGLLVGSVLPCENVAPAGERRRRFEIDPKVVLDTLRSLGEGPDQLLGFYHSHPDKGAELSQTDLEFVRLWPEMVWLVIPVFAGAPGAARAWWLRSSEQTVTEMEWI